MRAPGSWCAISRRAGAFLDGQTLPTESQIGRARPAISGQVSPAGEKAEVSQPLKIGCGRRAVSGWAAG